MISAREKYAEVERLAMAQAAAAPGVYLARELALEPTIPTTNAHPQKLDIIEAGTLMAQAFPPLVQAVEGLICEGLTMLVAASKVGKSWLALLMALRVAMGAQFLGRRTTKSRVLYFALEDSPRRLQVRLRALNAVEIPGNLSFVTKAQMLGTGFLEQLESWISGGDEPALIIVDTLQKVRGIARRNVNAYEGDYDAIGSIKALADKYRAMIVCVHHTNKAKNVTDLYDRVSGSTGIMGAADTTILIDRERGEDTATVHFEGRDVYGDDFVIRFVNGLWELEHSNAQEYGAGAAYADEPLVQLFRKLITENPKGGRWTYSNLQAIGLEFFGCQPFIDGRECTNRLSGGLATELRKRDGIIVESSVAVGHGRGVKLFQATPQAAFQTKIDENEGVRRSSVSSVSSVDEHPFRDTPTIAI